ncbi:hypothetical protein [Lentilactobacillus buchneri]|uniref:hypothetical protein n=1 Tax=Lentilactobacillus buchneri TaxID=1581 RepID=UPI0021A8841A|nr:hypothetical protein [Lentilactobacillus buchneri]MCT2882631.1 hypothetical protein [Lentilactobacillus buchneri]
MKSHKSMPIIFSAFVIGVGIALLQAPTSYAYSKYDSRNSIWSGNGTTVTFWKNVGITKMRNANPRSKSYPVQNYVVKKWSHYKLDHWGHTYSWVLQSGRFNSNSKYTYIVDKSDGDHSWFRFGYYEKPVYKNVTSKAHIKVADNTNFFGNKWRPAYLDEYSNGVKLYKSLDDAQNKSNPVKEVKKYTQKFEVKRQPQNILKVRLGDTTYYSDNSSHDLRPYNAKFEDREVSSYFSPKSKNALLKHGERIKENTMWTYMYYKHGKLEIRDYSLDFYNHWKAF